MRRRPVGLVFVVLGVLAAGLVPSAMAGAEEEKAPYVVVLDRGNDSDQVKGEHERGAGFQAKRVYRRALKGYAADLTASQLERVKRDHRVAYVEPDVELRPLAQSLPWNIDRINADSSSTNAGNGSGEVNGVNLYVIDSGLPGSSVDLNIGSQRPNFVSGGPNDCFGHGTHIAGIAAAKDNSSLVVGAAPGVLVTGVRVFTCGGGGASTSVVLSALDWVADNRVLPAVANLSMGASGLITSINDAVRNLASDAGVVVTVAAGNDFGANACQVTPAAAGQGNNGVITVGATKKKRDKVPGYSNVGPCVDVYAPGSKIKSLALDGGTTTMDGTSMSAPHAAGAAALYLSNNPNATPVQVENAIKNAATPTGQTKGGSAVKLLNEGSF